MGEQYRVQRQVLEVRDPEPGMRRISGKHEMVKLATNGSSTWMMRMMQPFFEQDVVNRLHTLRAPRYVVGLEVGPSVS